MHTHSHSHGSSAGGPAKGEGYTRTLASRRDSQVRARADERRGAVLVEFALITIAFYLLFAGTFEIGRMVFSAQILQNAARVGARELALIPLPATYTFDKALGIDPPYASFPEGSEEKKNADRVRTFCYDPRLLAVDLTAYSDESSYQAFIASWPPLNRMLLPLMLREDVNGVPYMRYPGALVDAPSLGIDATGDTRIVMVPVVTSRGDDGVETIAWHHVVEEIRANPDDSATGPFSMVPASPQAQQGLVALRINFPFQAGSLSAYQTHTIGESIVNDPVLANDGAVSIDGDSIALPGSLVEATQDGTYGGEYGLGKHYALAQSVRPFRRTLTAQSIFRREVFK